MYCGKHKPVSAGNVKISHLNPTFVKASQARFLRDTGRVPALTRNGNSKAYPLRILNRHEIVNDRFGGEEVIITYCPLCGSDTANKAKVNGSFLIQCLRAAL
ncbi:Protein of unknown function [Nitrosomonas aestuarii]|uniref:Uncharacterized protein n=1 Tax=Nitrosomonas aestuarii TaxID=52441 RepID=A0A1I4EYM4_9PROT|nr:DUF3179 domain-containing (seleno)protein [Nitrosomonas aestuarii]SFL10170.1 Protein of unknown function [Nitrosomonas aestuarii]